MTLFEYGTVVEALGFHWPDLSVLGYELQTCGPSGGITTVAGARLEPTEPLERVAEADTVIVTGVPDPRYDRCPQWSGYLREAAKRGARIVSVCTGAFALAEAGLLDGRRATTHWRHAHVMRSAFPRVDLVADEIVVRDGQFMTGAGAAAGLDLCLQIIRDDYGVARANEAARRLVVAPFREGGQAQYDNLALADASRDPEFARFLSELAEQVAGTLTLSEMAVQAHTSGRTLHRKFRRYTGTSPAEWVTRQRVLLAMRQLEHTDLPVEEVGRRSGFAAPETFRHHFRRLTGNSPLSYRKRFQPASDPGIRRMLA